MEVLFKAGLFAIITVGEPGDQGAGVFGTHGTGDPSAATTAGLDGAVHIPNGAIFITGLLSMIVATEAPAVTLSAGNTFSELGAAPNEHINVAPEVTSWLIRVGTDLIGN